MATAKAGIRLNECASNYHILSVQGLTCFLVKAEAPCNNRNPDRRSVVATTLRCRAVINGYILKFKTKNPVYLNVLSCKGIQFIQCFIDA